MTGRIDKRRGGFVQKQENCFQTLEPRDTEGERATLASCAKATDKEMSIWN